MNGGREKKEGGWMVKIQRPHLIIFHSPRHVEVVADAVGEATQLSDVNRSRGSSW